MIRSLTLPYHNHIYPIPDWIYYPQLGIFSVSSLVRVQFHNPQLNTISQIEQLSPIEDYKYTFGHIISNRIFSSVSPLI